MRPDCKVLDAVDDLLNLVDDRREHGHLALGLLDLLRLGHPLDRRLLLSLDHLRLVVVVLLLVRLRLRDTVGRRRLAPVLLLGQRRLPVLFKLSRVLGRVDDRLSYLLLALLDQLGLPLLDDGRRQRRGVRPREKSRLGDSVRRDEEVDTGLDLAELEVGGECDVV